MLEHGGHLRQAARAYGTPFESWLDLSTGINPDPWPVPPIPGPCWNRLPEEEDGLEAAAQAYFQTPHLLPTAGSQATIQILPRLLSAQRIGIPTPTYAEHAHAWRTAGRDVVPLSHASLEMPPDDVDLLLLVNPNNPTGCRYAPATLLAWAERLAKNKRWLVVDEAFMDTTPTESLSPHAGTPGLILLRSLGKFFGLAGARCGFLLAPPAIRTQASSALGPWSLAGPTRFAASLALQDRTWQTTTRSRLATDARRLGELLSTHHLPPSGGTDLFQWVRTPAARYIQDHMARQAVLVRAFDDPPSLRFGLPGREADWVRLERALAAIIVPTLLPPIND
ncbi:MAG: threonine-phosphate decarboxylase [Magnetococcales bacterium]|nr:threonine-phosphate decarboxylase [Magnetococcales bacterium]